MSEHATRIYTLTLKTVEIPTGVPAAKRLARLLKFLYRGYGFKCVSVEEKKGGKSMMDGERFFVIPTADGGEVIVRRNGLTGLDAKVQGIRTTYSVVVIVGEHGGINIFEVSEETYRDLRKELLGYVEEEK